MVLKIRLARFGRAFHPTYNIVVTHARTARGSKPLEVLGTYDPIGRVPLPSATAAQRAGEYAEEAAEAEESEEKVRRIKDVRLDVSRARYWLGVGAQPSEPAWRLLGLIGLVVPKTKGRAVLEEEKKTKKRAKSSA